MDLKTFFLMQLIAHLCLDYFFQSDAAAADKNEKGFRSRYLYRHFLWAFVLSWVFSLQWNFGLWALGIAVTHFLIDGFKKYLNSHKKLGKYAFYTDQLLHILILAAAVYGFGQKTGIQTSFPVAINFNFILVITGYLICLKPANIFVKEVFKSTDIQVFSDNEMPNAGKVIGVLERILTLTFILANQYAAVGFLIAAKSILRYRSDETLKSEYVLIGTMLSFGIAVLAGIVIVSFRTI